MDRVKWRKWYSEVLHAGDYRSAERGARIQLEETPDDPELLVHLGVALVELDRVDEARSAFRAAADRPPDPHALAQAGHVLVLLGDYEEARRLLRIAVAPQPEGPHPPHLVSLAGLLAEHDGVFDQAERHLRTAWESDPGWGDTGFQFASYLQRRGQVADALEVVEDSLRLTGRPDSLLLELRDRLKTSPNS